MARGRGGAGGRRPGLSPRHRWLSFGILATGWKHPFARQRRTLPIDMQREVTENFLKCPVFIPATKRASRDDHQPA